MAFDTHSNFAYSTVATAPSPASSGTSLVVQSGDGTKFPAVSFNATVCPAGTLPTTSNAEIVRVTAISTDTFTITRAQESSSARTIVVGDQIFAGPTKKWFTDIEGKFPVALGDGGTGGTSAATARTALGLGTIATQDASSVTLTGGTIAGLTSFSMGTNQLSIDSSGILTTAIQPSFNAGIAVAAGPFGLTIVVSEYGTASAYVPGCLDLRGGKGGSGTMVATPSGSVVSKVLLAGSLTTTSYSGGGTLNVTSTEKWDAGRTVTDGVSNSTTTITSATAAFTSTDVGLKVHGTDITEGTTISSVTNGTTAVLSAAATGTHSGLTWAIGGTGSKMVFLVNPNGTASNSHGVGGMTLDQDYSLTVDGTLKADTFIPPSGTLTLVGASNLFGTVNSVGAFSVATNKFNVVAASGNTTIAGTLGVTGATTLSSTLAITGALSGATNVLLLDGTAMTNSGTAGLLGTITSTGGNQFVWARDNTAAVTVGQTLFTLEGKGASDASHTVKSAASIAFVPEGTFSGSSSPGRIELRTTLSGATALTTRLLVDNAGTLHGTTTLTSNLVSAANWAIKADGSAFLGGGLTYASNQPTAGNFSVDTSGNGSFAGTLASGAHTVTGAITATTSIKSSGASGGVGYATGAGNAVSQTSTKATAFPTINALCGTLTWVSQALASDTTVTSGSSTNTSIASTDVVVFTHISGGTLGAYNMTCTPGSGTWTLTLRNTHSASLTEAPKFAFAIIKAVTS